MEGCFWSPGSWIVGKGRLGTPVGMLYCTVLYRITTRPMEKKRVLCPKIDNLTSNSRQSCAEYFGLLGEKPVDKDA